MVAFETPGHKSSTTVVSLFLKFLTDKRHTAPVSCIDQTYYGCLLSAKIFSGCAKKSFAAFSKSRIDALNTSW